jgi:hypothetical protein
MPSWRGAELIAGTNLPLLLPLTISIICPSILLNVRHVEKCFRGTLYVFASVFYVKRYISLVRWAVFEKI